MQKRFDWLHEGQASKCKSDIHKMKWETLVNLSYYQNLSCSTTQALLTWFQDLTVMAVCDRIASFFVLGTIMQFGGEGSFMII